MLKGSDLNKHNSYLPMSEHMRESAATAAFVKAHLCLVAKSMQMQIIATEHTKASTHRQQRLD